MIGTSDAATAVPVAIADNDESASGRLYGRALLLARAAWVGVAILVVAYVIAAIPTKYAALLNSRGGGLTPGMFATYEISIFGVAVALFEAVAALLVWHRSGARMALISAFALVTFPVYADPQQAVAPVAPLWHWTGSGLALTGIIALTLLVYLVPDGRFVPVWTRWIVAPWLVIEAGRQFAPATAWDYTGWPAGLSLLVLAGGLGPALGVMLYRYRKVSTAIQRQQTKWLVWGVLLAVGTVLLASLIVDLLPVTLQRNLLVTATADTVRVCASLLVPLAIAISIGRHRLWALDLLVQRALVYAALTVIVVGLYVLTVGALSTVLSRRGDVLISLAATGLVAFLVQPLRVRLQRAVNRLIYGERDDPHQALSRLARRLEGSIAPDALLPAILETVVSALRLPYAAIALQNNDQLTIVASHGQPVPDPLTFPLSYQLQPLGQLLLAPRSGTAAFGEADQRLLADLAHQAGLAIHTTQLTAEALRLSTDLQRARTRLVSLREEERRRLRRDLHDGLGPALACITLQAETARDLLLTDPRQADTVLTDLTGQAQAAIADIRRVVYDLRPAALDDLGLVGAVRAYAAQLVHHGVSIQIYAPEAVSPLPAAVEVAAYRIVQEALTNVFRHAGAGNCTVNLALDDALRIEVADDGRGLPSQMRAGVGLQSMRERAAELGGTCVVECRTGAGTLVSASLPLILPDTASNFGA